MSKNITIQEGGVARTLSGVEKIVTNVAGESGTQNWIPEDEAANYVSTGELNARENGTYISRDDGYVGYSKIEVSVTPNVGELNVSDNGTYYAQDDGYDGFSKVVVDVEGGGGGATLITKEITEDGTYDASDDDADGYSSVTVNVGSGGTLITKQITQNGTYNASEDNADGYSSVTVNISNEGMLETPLLSDYNNNNGKIKNGVWSAVAGKNNRIDIYGLIGGHFYLIFMGGVVGDCFNAMACDTTPEPKGGMTPTLINGVPVSRDNSAPEAHAVHGLWPTPYVSSGNSYRYLMIQKTSQNQNGIKTYVVDVTKNIQNAQ